MLWIMDALLLKKFIPLRVFGCEIPKEFEIKFKSMSFDEIDEYTIPRITSLRELYEYLLTFEE